jgi:hypothetical protein
LPDLNSSLSSLTDTDVNIAGHRSLKSDPLVDIQCQLRRPAQLVNQLLS